MFARWRALRAEDSQWSERGFIWVPLLVATGVGLMLYWGVKVGVEYAQGELSGPSAPPPIAVASLATLPGIPDNDCTKRILAQFPGTVKYENGTWTAPDTRTPKLPFQPDKGEVLRYNKEVKDWNELMLARVGTVVNEMKSADCFKEQPPIEPPKTKGPEPEQVSIFGTYYLKPTSTPNPECANVLPSSLTVSAGGSKTEFNLDVAGSTDIPGKSFQNLPLTSGLTFQGDDQAHYWSISGGFIQRSSGVVVTGTFTYNVGGGCGIDYEGSMTR